jgi:transposase
MNISTIDCVWLVLDAVDMRLGIDGLSSRVVQYLGKSPCDGHAYAFTNRSRNRLKLVVWDGNGVWLCQRRLHQGHFVWPQSIESSYEVSEAQWQWLVNGIDWRHHIANNRRPNSSRTGANERRCSIIGPCFFNAAKCLAVG